MHSMLSNRLQILLILKEKDATTDEIVKELSLPANELNHHLISLEQLDILEKVKNGENIVYHIKEKSQEKVLNLIKNYSK